MELKKLYRDAVILCKKELPLNDFLLWCDIAARAFLGRYPKKLLLPKGEYITPRSISDRLMIDTEFYNAVLYFVAGGFCADAGYRSQAEEAANAAYLKLWRESARGKRMKGDVW